MKPSRRMRVERSASILVALCAGTGWFVISAVLLEFTEPREQWPLAILSLAALLFAPLVTSSITRRFAPSPGKGSTATSCLGRAVRALHGLEFLLLFLLPAPPGIVFVLGLAMLAQGHLLVRSSALGPAIGCVLVGPLVALWTLAWTPSWLLLVVAPTAVLLALASGLFLHERACHEQLAGEKHRPPVVAASRARTSTWRRMRTLPPLSLAFALLALAFAALLADPPGSRSAGEDDSTESYGGVAKRGPSARANEGGRKSGSRGGSSRDFSSELGFGTSGIPFGTEIALRVRSAARPGPSDQPLAEGPFLMREHVLDLFEGDLMRMSRTQEPPEVRDRQDGQRDGWSQLAAEVPADERLRLSVEAEPRILEEVGWTVVFAPRPLLALREKRVLHSPDSFTVLPRREESRWSYELIARDDTRQRGRLANRRARHPDVSYLQRPADSPAMERIAREGRSVTAGAGDDRERVALLLEHFLTRFDYSLDDQALAGPPAIATFLDRRRGFCTLFSAAMVLMLREQGISSRVAVGYSAKEWSDEEQAWVARDRDAHAWVEVYWEGLGWLAEDPTPPDRVRHAFDVYDGVAEEESEAWLAKLRDRFARWIESSGQDVSLGELARLLLAGPASLSLAWRWTLVALLAAGLLALTRPKPTQRSPAAGPPPAPNSPRARLIRALAARGHVRRPAQTLSELVREAQRREGPNLPPMDSVLASLESWRFGGHQPSAEALRSVEETLVALHP